MGSDSRADRRVADIAYRKVIFSVLLLITASAGLLFSVLNFFQGIKALAAVEFTMAILSLGLLAWLPRLRNLQRWIVPYLALLLAGMLFIFLQPRTSPSVFIWVLLIPLVAHLLLGRMLGVSLSFAAIVLAGAIYLWRFHDRPALVSPLELANMLVCMLAVLVLSHVYEAARERSDAKLRLLATTDNLTGLANRLRFTDVFEWERKKARRENYPLALIMLDLDHFKSVNDNHGHEAGDQVLQHVARRMSTRLRATDLLCRIGGEEFAVLVPKGTSAQVERLVGELQQVINSPPCKVEGQPLSVTFSAGIAQLGRDGDDLRALFSAADRRMYQAKHGGRNRIVSTDPAAPDLDAGAQPSGGAPQAG